MRFALETKPPLTEYKCWYGIKDIGNDFLFRDLRRRINKDLELAPKSSQLSLLLKGYSLLPQLRVKDIIRDEDVITIVQKDSQKVKVKKRKKETAAEEEEKPKKEEKESRKRKVSEVAEASTVSAKRGRTTEQTPEKEEKPTQETPQPPKQGLTKTQRRNLRRKRSKLRQRENAQKEADNVSTSQQQQQQQQQSEAEPAQEQEQVNVNEPAPLNIKPLSLLSKNKNKKKNFLQFMSQKQPKHVKFSEDGETAYEVTDETYTTEAQMDGTYYNENEEQQYNDYNYYYDNSYQGAEEAQVNEYGAAFVSYHEADPSYEYNNDENSRRNVTNDEKPAAEEKEQEEQPAVAAPVVQQRNYDELPKVDGFGSLVGKVDSLLAIQTLVLSPQGAPEISGWKEVKLIGIDNDAEPPSITVEYQPGFWLKRERIAKFELREEGEESDAEQDEYLPSQVKTLHLDDVLEMRLIPEE